MAANFQIPKFQSALHKVNSSDADFNNLVTFVTEVTNRLFALLTTTGVQESNGFLS